MKHLVIILFFVSIIFNPLPIAYAQSQDELAKKLEEKQAEIQKLETHLEDARSKSKTLKSQLGIIDSQTKITELKIEEISIRIEKLKREIFELSTRIDRISTSIDTLSEILLKRIIQTYKYGALTTLDLIFSSDGFAQILERTKYIQVAQANDKKVLYQLQATKSTYNDQRQDKQTKQNEAKKLNQDLENYKNQLDQQKKDKENLLAITKNDESRYQQEIARLQAELASIAQAISNVGPKIGPVQKGETIAAMGSTGCSTGPHLHYEVFENAKIEGGRVIGNRVDPNNYLGSKLGSPLNGYPGGDWIITTEYGEIYFLGTHTGLDIAPKGGGGLGRAIVASEKGTAYSVSAICSVNIAGGSSVGKGVVIDHENGLVTLYWHIL